jgi:hypothetical protein
MTKDLVEGEARNPLLPGCFASLQNVPTIIVFARSIVVPGPSPDWGSHLSVRILNGGGDGFGRTPGWYSDSRQGGVLNRLFEIFL